MLKLENVFDINKTDKRVTVHGEQQDLVPLSSWKSFTSSNTACREPVTFCFLFLNKRKPQLFIEAEFP